jgi:hypothetical protein
MTPSRTATSLSVILAAALLVTPARAPAEEAEPKPVAQGTGAPAAGASAGAGSVSRSDVDALAAEVRRLKLEVGIPDVQYKSFSGLGPAASKVYFVPKGLSIGGYGEVVYQNNPSNAHDSNGTLLRQNSDIRRFVLYAGYRFADWIVFNGELEMEHATEAEVEFAYVDFLFSDAVGMRVGSMLVPIGFVNEMHEPPFFSGVNRPDLETNLIPTTWRENGVGLHGDVSGLKYKAFLLTGLDAFRPGTSSAGTWLRGARAHGANALAATFALVLNAAYDVGPVTLGGTVYRGQAGQDAKNADGEPIRADVLVAEAHAQLSWRRLQLRGIYVVGTLGDSVAVSQRLGLTGTDVLGSRARGGYVEAAYDVLGALVPTTDQALLPFVRFEAMNLHDQVPAGGVKNPAVDTETLTVGVNYKPIPNVVLKADYQRRTNGVPGDDGTNQLNFGVGFVF